MTLSLRVLLSPPPAGVSFVLVLITLLELIVQGFVEGDNLCHRISG